MAKLSTTFRILQQCHMIWWLLKSCTNSSTDDFMQCVQVRYQVLLCRLSDELCAHRLIQLGIARSQASIMRSYVL
jgi:hypothetical protein